MGHVVRDYDAIAARLSDSTGPRPQRMRQVVDALWEALAPTGASWVGFYVWQGGDELVLAVCRDKPACSPIGLHGACGRAFRERCSLIVRDVSALGGNYIACDPRDRSEIVIPCFEPDGTCWGVLDLDSHETGAFAAADAAGLHRVLSAAGLTHGPPPPELTLGPD